VRYKCSPRQSASHNLFQDGTKVLHEISFHIASGERVGIVGRTGSGKVSAPVGSHSLTPDSLTELFDSLPSPLHHYIW
jgi:ABC-type dipeptide/oligopeptide/nickel transport system ATPase component